MPIKALVWKELRSNALVFAVGAVAYGVWLLASMGWFENWFSRRMALSELAMHSVLITTEGALWYALLTGGVSIALGINAVRSESAGKLWQFVLFRPVNRRTLLAIKMAVGCVTSSLLSLLPLVAYFSWLRLPGSQLGPFDWSFVLPTGFAWIWTPVMFLAAFLSGLREGRWWWSKLWPVLAVVTACFWLWFLPFVDVGGFAVPRVVTWGSWLLCFGLLAGAILDVADEQDFS